MEKRTARKILWWTAGILTGWAVVFTVLAAVLLRPAIIKPKIERALSTHLKCLVSLEALRVGLWPRVRVTGVGMALRKDGDPSGAPFISIRSFTVDLGPFAMLREEINEVHLEGLRIDVPPGGLHAASVGAGKRTSHLIDPTIGRVFANDAVLTIDSRKPEHPPLVFPLHSLEIDNAGVDAPMVFKVSLVNPVPEGLVDAEGTFGPWQGADLADTGVQGTYVMTKADLNTINGIGGLLSSRGSFKGTLGSIDVEGTTDTPDFSLDLGGKPSPLTTSFQATVDGLDGTTVLHAVHAKLYDTAIEAKGAIVNLPGPGRHTVDIDATVTDGHIEDLLRLAMDAPAPVMTGDVSLACKMSLPPGAGPVRDRLRLDGHFGLNGTKFTSAQVEQKLADLSRRGEGKNKDDAPSRVMTELTGRFSLERGVLYLPDLAFAVPGASVALDGTYALKSGALDFHGELRLQATLSNAVGGFKSIFLKPIDLLFKKRGAGTLLPVKISGTRDAPQFGLDVKRIFR